MAKYIALHSSDHILLNWSGIFLPFSEGIPTDLLKDALFLVHAFFQVQTIYTNNLFYWFEVWD